MASSELGSEKWRMRPSAIVALPENTGSYSGPSTAATSSARPEPRTSRKNPCRMPRLASPDGPAARSAGPRARPCRRPAGACRRRRARAPGRGRPAGRARAGSARRCAPRSRTAACRGCRRCASTSEVIESASAPTTRIEPLATAVVNGESRGTNRRTYGSSELSWKRSVSSASAPAVREIRPVPVTASRGDAASISPADLVAAKRERRR